MGGMTEGLEDTVKLGQTDIRIPAIGVGAWAWGDRFMWGYGKGYGDETVHEAFEASLSEGINFFDTAEIYGGGKSESLLGRFIQESGKPVLVATKFMPYPWRLRRSALINSLLHSLERLQMEKVDLYQIHWPLPPVTVETWAAELVKTVKTGITRAVGVSNYSVGQMRRVAGVLEKAGIPLASNQVEYSLLNRAVERNGVLNYCLENGVTLIAYSPIRKGLLTGKYTPENPPPGTRGRMFTRTAIARAQPLIQLMREIGQAHDSKTPSQVALNWLICKGTVPIPGAKNARQAQENAGAIGWRLAEAEVKILDEASLPIS
jgi:aryl-alcohol dehydrogenase-like predicted oxidoreductase